MLFILRPATMRNFLHHLAFPVEPLIRSKRPAARAAWLCSRFRRSGDRLDHHFFLCLIQRGSADASRQPAVRTDCKQHEHQQYQRTVQRKGPPVNGNRECTRIRSFSWKELSRYRSKGCSNDFTPFLTWQCARTRKCGLILPVARGTAFLDSTRGTYFKRKR